MEPDKIYIDIENSESKENAAAHHGKQISLVSVSPNGTYVVTYSSEDTSIEGWIVGEDVDNKVSKWIPLKPDPKVNAYTPNSRYAIEEIKVSDNKIVLYGNRHHLIEIINMSDNNHPFEIKIDSSLSSLYEYVSPYYFKKNGNLIINNRASDLRQILVYSLQNNIKLISTYYIYKSVNDDDDNNNNGYIIDDNDNIWVISSNYLYQWKLEPLQLELSYSLGFDKINEVKIRKDLIMVKYEKGIEIYSKGVHFPIRVIQTEYPTTKIELLCDRYLLVIMDEGGKQHIRLYNLIDNNKRPVDTIKIFKDEEPENNIFLYEYNTESKKAFGLVNGKISSMNLSNLNCHDFFKSNHVNEKNEKEEVAISWDETLGWKAYLNENYYESNVNDVDDNYDETLNDMQNIIKVFSTIESEEIMYFKNKKYKWKIDHHKISVYDSNEAELDSKDFIEPTLSDWKILNNDALVLLYRNHMIIYKYDINNKSIKIQYYYSNYRKVLSAKEFSGSSLPINIDKDDRNFKSFNEWIKNFIEDNKYLAKYGQTLLPILIQKKLTSHIESIYSKCVRLAKGDPKRNLKFLNIITLSMKGLYKEYPDYIARFNSEILMFLDPFPEKFSKKYHHFAFSKEIDTLKYSNILSKLYKYFIYFLLILFFPITITAIVVPIVYESVYKSNIIDQIVHDDGSQYISLIVPYVDFSCYSLEYDWWRDLFIPQSSAFVETCKEKGFYTNWNGEAVINFKWKKFGRYYYYSIWLIFAVFFICFIIASYPSDSITQDIRIRLYKITIVFGFLHLVFELRQFIWNPIKYFGSIWNWFDLGAYLSTSFHMIYYDNTPDWVLLISCLFLDLKFLLFFRVFKLFDVGIYFAIIFGVAKQVLSFLVILAIVIISFAHVFFVFLHHTDSLSMQNESDQNINLFYSYPTSLLAMYRFLTGDQSSLSSRAPTPENSMLLILTALFSFVVVIYLMNLFIGLLNIAIEKEDHKASYLVLKAEILAEIELFYLLPLQRRWRTWFPEVIYYTVSIEKARIYAKKAINDGKWKKDKYDYNILALLHIEDAVKNY